MEKGLVLNSCQTRVMQELAVHKVSLLKEVVWFSLIELPIPNIIRVFDDLYAILSSLWVKSTLHQYIEEQTNCCIVRE